MKYFLYLLFICTPLIYADNKISAPYDDRCDNKIETFHKVNDLEISDRYYLRTTLNLNKITDLYILDRDSSSNKSDSCPYSDPTLHNFVFIVKNKGYKAIIYKKLLSNLDHIRKIFLNKTVEGFSISIWYGQGTPAEVNVMFKITPNKGIFLKKVTYQKIVPDGEDNHRRVKNFPESKKYELSNIVLKDFF